MRIKLLFCQIYIIHFTAGWIETEKVSPTLSENDPNSKTETGPGSRWASIDTNQVQLPIPGKSEI